MSAQLTALTAAHALMESAFAAEKQSVLSSMLALDARADDVLSRIRTCVPNTAAAMH